MKKIQGKSDRAHELATLHSKPAVHPDAAHDRALQKLDEKPTARFCERFFRLRHDNQVDADRIAYCAVIARAAVQDGRCQLIGEPTYVTHSEGFSVLHLQWIEMDAPVSEMMDSVPVVSHPLLRVP